MDNKSYKNETFTGERALFNVENVQLDNCIFCDGESPLKESHNIVISNSFFKYRYPLWYGTYFSVNNTKFETETRAGCWYTNNAVFSNCVFDERKWFRKSSNITLNDCTINSGEEYFWYCDNINLNNVSANGNYFCMNSKDVFAKGLKLNGKYSFQGCKHVVVEDSILDTKDAFWDCEDVVVKNSTIKGEYLSWNTAKIRFENCVIESLQGLCYIHDLTLINCKMEGTSLAFEFCSKINAEINSSIDSVKNPISGVIKAKEIKELIMEDDMINPKKTKIVKING